VYVGNKLPNSVENWEKMGSARVFEYFIQILLKTSLLVGYIVLGTIL
jgi:hypothetical protein